MSVQIIVGEQASQGDSDPVVRGLQAYNEARVGTEAGRPIAVSAYDGGVLLGGLVGVTQWCWLYIRHLWVSEDVRRHGVESQILATAGTVARSRGCRAVWLNTFSYQAPGFYKAIGYEEFGVLEDCPPGEAFYFLWKSL
jgi:GNAT superfamily N-acetyltransferase